MDKPKVDAQGYYEDLPLVDFQEDWPIGLTKMDITPYQVPLNENNSPAVI